MEARLLASVLQTDTHKRLAAADEISEYLKKDDTNLDEFAEIDRFVSALGAWMGSSNFKVNLSQDKNCQNSPCKLASSLFPCRCVL